MRYQFGDCELDTACMELRRDGSVVPIEPQVFDLLRYLIERADQFVSRDELFESIWHGRTVSDSALSSRIKAARKAIGDTGADQKLIRTLHGRGFRFVGNISKLDDLVTGARSATYGPEKFGPAASQEIRYCVTGDGVNIAYAVAGQGEPIVKTANWLNHLELDWQSPIWRHWLDVLTAGNLLLRYDERGTGLSDWSVETIKFEDLVDDLEAVVDSSGIDRFALLGISQGCAVSIAYAVRHPERVTRLVLYGGYIQGWRTRGNPREIARREAMETLIAEGWGQDNPTFRQIFSSIIIPRGSRQQMEWFNEIMKASASPENAVRLHDAFGRIDVSNLLPQVQTSTLVVHTRADQMAPFEQGKLMAAGIPNSRFLVLDSENHLLTADEPSWPFFIDNLRQFLSPGG